VRRVERESEYFKVDTENGHMYKLMAACLAEVISCP
jgi:hypothetical protein